MQIQIVQVGNQSKFFIRFHELTLWFAHRNPPGGPEAYEFGLRWMHVKASQLLFVAIYEVISGAYCEVL